MRFSALKEPLEEILAAAGIAINGAGPSDITIKDDRFFARVISNGSLGLGESYVDGWWECENIDDFFYRLFISDAEEKVRKNLKLVLRSLILNVNNRSRAFQVAQRHYDLGNELYQKMLDKKMNYSCGYWKQSDHLDAAQEAKLDLICRKLDIRPGQRILDIGCGWGGFVHYAAEKFGANCVGITVSKEQQAYAEQLCGGLPLEIRLQDYRDLNETFDHIVSVGMLEHVGYRNYRTYMEIVRRCLRDDGLFLLHTIGENCSKFAIDPWIEKYIFPNSLLPSMKQIGDSAEKLFIIEDWHNFGADYDPTLMSWFNNFDKNWQGLKYRFDDRFYRMWKYYLLSCAGAFRARRAQVWQIVMSKKGIMGGYNAVR